jgi:hypothetical protein
MLDSMQGLSALDGKERDACITKIGCRYTMGLVASNDLRIEEDRKVQRLWKD